MANNFLSLAGWYFLPNLVTSYTQSLLYTIFIRAGDPKPTPGSPRFIRDRKRIHIFVIVVYLLYTIYEADYQLRQEGDFYQVLGVPHDVEERALQSRFRRLTVQYHPDKSPASSDKAKTEAVYVHLKLARDTLVDPSKRFAYDRFGPEILGWRHCKSIRDFVFTGAQRTAMYYAGSAGFLVLLSVLGYLQSGGKFWRYLVMAGLFSVELHTITRPSFPAVLTGVINPIMVAMKLREPYLPFQFLVILRKLAITFFIALAQLAPIISAPSTPQHGDTVSPQQLDRLDALTTAVDHESSRLMGLELSPFAGESGGLLELRASLKEWLVQNTIRNDPEVKAAIQRVLDRRRRGDEGGGVLPG